MTSELSHLNAFLSHISVLTGSLEWSTLETVCCKLGWLVFTAPSTVSQNVKTNVEVTNSNAFPQWYNASLKYNQERNTMVVLLPSRDRGSANSWVEFVRYKASQLHRFEKNAEVVAPRENYGGQQTFKFDEKPTSTLCLVPLMSDQGNPANAESLITRLDASDARLLALKGFSETQFESIMNSFKQANYLFGVFQSSVMNRLKKMQEKLEALDAVKNGQLDAKANKSLKECLDRVSKAEEKIDKLVTIHHKIVDALVNPPPLIHKDVV